MYRQWDNRIIHTMDTDLDADEPRERKRARESSLLDGLEKAPNDVMDARPGVAYKHNGHARSNFEPYRVVKAGRRYQRACELCFRQAIANNAGETPRFCMQHGGGKIHYCVHEKLRAYCAQCREHSKRV